MTRHLLLLLVFLHVPTACGIGPKSRHGRPPHASVSFCAPGPGSVDVVAEATVHFPDTIRVVGDSRDRTPGRRENPPAGTFIGGREWFSEGEPIPFASTAYFPFGPPVVAHSVGADESGETWVKYLVHDGIPFYGPAGDDEQPSRLHAAEGLPCRLQPYSRREDVQ